MQRKENLKRTYIKEATKGWIGQKMMLKYATLVLLISLEYLVTPIEGCSCAAGLPVQGGLCSSPIVMRVKALERYVRGPQSETLPDGSVVISIGPQDVHYIIKINKIYRDNTTWEYNPTYGVVKTPSQGSLCGIGMTIGEEYIIVGTPEDDTGFIQVYSCSYFRIWDRMSRYERKIFANQVKNCDCQINVCYDQSTCDLSLPCSYVYRSSGTDCYNTDSYCFQNKGICRWKDSPQLQACLNQI